ncbi:MAG: hypothetical protein U0W40_03360 [Acidimicrobiia bacterium]
MCYEFPDLRVVMCHGAEPDEALAVKLMLKWPGLHFADERLRAAPLPAGDRRLRELAERRR